MPRENKIVDSNKAKLLYVSAVLDDRWSGGEPIVARDTITMLKKMGYEVSSSFYSFKYVRFLNRLFSQFRVQLDFSDSFILSYLYYRKIIRKTNPDIIIAQYDFDSSIIKAAIDQQKKILVYIPNWWPICPKTDLLKQDGSICSGYINNDCKNCILSSSKIDRNLSRILYRLIVRFFTNNKILHIKMDNRINMLNASNVSIIVLTENMKNRLVNEGLKPDKIEVGSNGVNCDEFSPSERKEMIVGYFGGEYTSKGYKIFFKLAEFIKQLYPEVKFVATGNYRNKSEYVEFLGKLDRDAFRQMVSKCRCTVVPSIWEEPFSLVTLESMACGVPVVAFDVGSLKSIIVDGKTGFVVPKGNIEYMAQRIIRILNDDQLFSELSYNARQWVCAEFNESKRIYSLLEIIEKNLQ